MFTFKNVIDEIEQHITEEIDVSELARMAGMSMYEFRRIFSFVTGVSYAEYVRKRRLSLAAVELHDSNKTVTELAVKYGYDSPSSFSRAFKEFHGISPSEAGNGKRQFRVMTRINTQIITTGGGQIDYSIFQKPAFTIWGVGGCSQMTDTECCEDVWQKFYDSGLGQKLCADAKNLYAVYENGENCVKCCIGVVHEETQGQAERDVDFVTKEGTVADVTSVTFPASEWVAFQLRGTEDAYVNGFYKDILSQWFASVGYTRNSQIPNMEVFPADMSEDDFTWEIWIPIHRNKEMDTDRDIGQGGKQ